MFVAAPSSLLSLVQLAPTPSYMHEFIRTKTCGPKRPSTEQNLIGSLVGKPARLTTGYTISLSKHVLQLISFNRSSTHAHRTSGARAAARVLASGSFRSPAAHMLYSDNRSMTGVGAGNRWLHKGKKGRRSSSKHKAARLISLQLRWEPANATGFSLRTRVPRYHYLGVLVR